MKLWVGDREEGVCGRDENPRCGKGAPIYAFPRDIVKDPEALSRCAARLPNGPILDKGKSFFPVVLFVPFVPVT